MGRPRRSRSRRASQSTIVRHICSHTLDNIPYARYSTYGHTLYVFRQLTITKDYHALSTHVYLHSSILSPLLILNSAQESVDYQPMHLHYCLYEIISMWSERECSFQTVYMLASSYLRLAILSTATSNSVIRCPPDF